MPYQNLSFQQLEALVDQARWEELRRLIRSVDPADVADFLEGLDPDARDTVFDMLDLETASDVLTELGPYYVDEVVEDMTSAEIADLAERMAPDEAAEFLSDLGDEHTAAVLAEMEPRERAEVSSLLQYPEGTAGHIMTPEVLSMPPDSTVRDVRDAMERNELSDPIFNVYVVEPNSRKLLGIVTLAQLVVSPPGARLGDIASRDYVFAGAADDQEDVARKFRRYHMWVVPVVDDNHRLVGRITADDVLDVFHEEADEDLALLVGAPDIEEAEQSPLRIARMRLPWLLITMFVGLMNSVIIKTMLNVTDVVAIAVFVPAILAMGGNTGMQSSAIAIRGIALGQQAYGRLMVLVGREVRVGLYLGLVCASITALLVWLVLSVSGADTGGIPPGRLAGVVALAMGNAMVFASAYGSIVPVVLHRMRVDPAIASGPFVTTSNDLSASLIYFGTCTMLLLRG